MRDLKQPIGKHFLLSEVVKSNTAARHGLDNLSPLTDDYLQNAIALAENVLDPIREHWGCPVLISSWFRSKALNNLTPGSSHTSQHCIAAAADHTVKGISVIDAFNWLAFESGLPYDQVILEYAFTANGQAPSGNGWNHVSFARGRAARRQILRKDFGQPYRPVTKPIIL